MDSKLREKVLTEQDKLIYFSYTAWEECLLFEHIDSELDFRYGDFNGKFLGENLEIIPELKTKNLLYLMNSSNDEVKKMAKEIVLTRVKENGEHFCGGENSRYNTFGIPINSMLQAFKKLDKEEVKYIRDCILAKYKAVEEENPYAHSIIKKAEYMTSIDNFLAAYDKGIFTSEKLYLLNRLAQENPNVLDSINYRIFQDSIYEMGEEFISRIAKYPNLSNKLIIVAENSPQLLDVIKQGFSELEGNKRMPEILAIQSKVITYAAKKFNQLEGIDFNNLVNCALRNDITFNYKNAQNYEQEFERKCDEEYEKISQSSKHSNVSEKKKILLMKHLGIDEKDAEKFCMRFSSDIDSVEVINQDAKKYLDNLQQILQLEDGEEVDRLYYSFKDKITPFERLHFEDVLREAYAKSYVKVLSETDKKLNNISESVTIDIDGNQVKQINLKGDFNLLVHSTDSGFKGKKQLKDGSFVKSWNEIADTERHLASSCYITQDFLGHVPANENGVVAVFTQSKAEEINLMGPSDINSNVQSYDYSSGRGLYIAAENMSHNARRVYSEIPVERRNPDYLLIFDDMQEQVRQNSYKAAAEFGIPVIFIDKREVERNQLENLDKLVKEFQETEELSVLSTLVSTYETNVAGWLLNREPNENDDSLTKGINNERFRIDFDERENTIYIAIKSYLNKAIESGNREGIAQIVSIMENEIQKYNLVDLGKTPISKTKMKFNAQAIIDGIKQKAPEMLEDKVEEPRDVQITRIDLSKLSGEISNSRLIGKNEIDLNEKRLERETQKEVRIDD